jgi:hypothetical protein
VSFCEWASLEIEWPLLNGAHPTGKRPEMLCLWASLW